MRNIDRKRFAAGFTLIEMMVVVSIVAILLALAVPGFNAVMASSRMESRTQALLSSVQFARSEAIRSNGNVYVCALNSQNNPSEPMKSRLSSLAIQQRRGSQSKS